MNRFATAAIAPARPGRGFVCAWILSALLAAWLPAHAQTRAETPADLSEPPPDAGPPVPDSRAAWPLRMINGMESIRADAFRVAVYRGSATENAGRALIQIPRTLTIDIRTVGVLGRDDVATVEDAAGRSGDLVADATMPNGYRATYRAGHRFAGLPIAGWYHVVYLARRGQTGTVMLTRQQSSMRLDRPGDARPPADFIYRRLSPAVHYFDPETGFRPMICYGWPKPACNWTRLGPDRDLQVLQNGASTEIAEIDATAWVPPTGRILKLQAVVSSAGGTGGAYLKSLPNYPGEFLVGHVAKPDGRAVSFVEIATNSRGKIHYRLDPGVRLDLYAMGFTMLQPF